MAYNDRIINHEDGLDIIDQMVKTNKLLGAKIRSDLDMSTINWSKLEGFAHEGVFGDVFEYGDQFVDKWKDTATNTEYAYPWQLSAIRDVTLHDGEVLEKRPVLGLHYAHAFGVQFSHQRAFLACPDGLPAGAYHFTIESSWGSNVSAGDVVRFVTTQDVPAGGRVAGCYYCADYAKSSWKIYTYSADGKTVIETITPTFASQGGDTNLGIQKINTRNGNLNSTQEMGYGWNRYKNSALRQYLNSDKGIGQWWTATDAWDIAPDELTTKAGFMTGLPEDLKAIMKEVKVVTYANTVNDGGEMDVTYDKVFIPSLEEMYINPQISGEGEAHEYYKRKAGTTSPLAQYGTYPQMITYAVENHTSAQAVRLRSAIRGVANRTWTVSASGDVGSSYAHSATRFCPLIVI